MYEVADGTTIPTLGEKAFVGISEEGDTKWGVTTQVCEVNKALLSVRRMVQAGNRVVFDPDGSYIEDRESGRMTWLHDEGGMYILNLWVQRGGADPFTRRDW